MHPKVLIVGTVPYDPQESSRAFDAYFHNWERENIAQIFSNPKDPCKGHCDTLFQITDRVLLNRWLGKSDKGKIYFYDSLCSAGENKLQKQSKSTENAYRIGRKHTPLTRLLRGMLWRKRFWCTPELNAWLDDFGPECVFLAFSDDFFIPQIALYVAERYEIPIVSCIGDDYYFNKHFSVDPLYQIYKESYKALIRKVLAHPGSAIYISDKIRDKYNTEFGLDGETVYLTSTVKRKPFCPVDTHNPCITYFGNIQMGRNQSLCDIADALGELNPMYRLEVYSNEADEQYYQKLKENPHVVYGGAIPYQQVQEKMRASDVTVIVEGFEERDIELSRYSLSTKAADALASGAAILTYGSDECGIVEYMRSTNAAMVCSDKSLLKQSIQRLLEDQSLQEAFYKQQIIITEEHHNLVKSCETSERVIAQAIRNYTKK